MIKAIDSLMQGFSRARDSLVKATERVAGGDISAESLIDVKLSAHDAKVQATALAKVAEEEDKLLDILA